LGLEWSAGRGRYLDWDLGDGRLRLGKDGLRGEKQKGKSDCQGDTGALGHARVPFGMGSLSTNPNITGKGRWVLGPGFHKVPADSQPSSY